MSSARAEISIAAPTAAELGERPIWDDQTGEIVWVDIVHGMIHRQTPGGDDRLISLSNRVGAVGLRANGGYIAASATSFLVLDEHGMLEKPPIDIGATSAGVSFNDGAVDAAGRFWAGTSSLTDERARGALYRLEPDGSVHSVFDGITESNGIAWSPDSRTMYYVDSGIQEIGAWNYDIASGEPTGHRTFAHFSISEGTPDGLVVDAGGNVWVALWGGSAVRCYSEVGLLLRAIELPVSRVTCPGFGGVELTDLYVTTAWEGSTVIERSREPTAGHLFIIADAGRGQRTNRFDG